MWPSVSNRVLNSSRTRVKVMPQLFANNSVEASLRSKPRACELDNEALLTRLLRQRHQPE